MVNIQNACSKRGAYECSLLPYLYSFPPPQDDLCFKARAGEPSAKDQIPPVRKQVSRLLIFKNNLTCPTSNIPACAHPQVC